MGEAERDEKMNDLAAQQKLAAQDRPGGNSASDQQLADRSGKGGLNLGRMTDFTKATTETKNRLREDPLMIIKQEEKRHEELIAANPLLQARLKAREIEREEIKKMNMEAARERKRIEKEEKKKQ